MVGEVYLSDNSGNRVPPDPRMADPVAASGVTLNVGKDVAGNTAVVGGQSYVISTVGSAGGRWAFSITGALTVAENIEWIANANDHIIIEIPQGKILLYYLLKEATGIAYMRTLKPEN